MPEDIRQHIRHCSVCQKNKTNSNQKPGGLLVPLQIPGRRWEMISADLIAQLPMTKSGNTQIVVFVDTLSKMVQFAAVLTASTAYNMARLFLHNLIRLHGTQREIVSDRDTLFTSAFWEELTAALGTKLAMSTACHPANDGQTERTTEHWTRKKGILSVLLRMIGMSIWMLLSLPSTMHGRNQFRILVSC